MRTVLLPPETNGLDNPAWAQVPCYKDRHRFLDGVGAVGFSAGVVPGESTWAGGFQHSHLLSDKPWLFPSVPQHCTWQAPVCRDR